MSSTRQPKSKFLYGHNDFQARLNALPGSDKNNFSDSIWTFSEPSGATIFIDFHILNYLEIKHKDWLEDFEYDILLATKSAWIYSAETTVPNMFKTKLIGILLLWTSLASVGSYNISKRNLGEILAYILMRKWEDGRLVQRRAPISGVSFRKFWSPNAWRSGFNTIGMHLIPSGLETFYITTLKQLIPSLTGDELTYSDWSKGSTFNHLTLDYGQYYVEHCLDFFEKNLALAIGLSSVYSSLAAISLAVELNVESVIPWINILLHGKSAEELRKSRKGVGFRPEKIDRVTLLVRDQFKQSYKQARFRAVMLRDDTLSSLCFDLGLGIMDSNIDRLRFIVFEWLNQNSETDIETLLKDCNPPVSFSKFTMKLKMLHNASYDLPCSIPTEAEYRALGLREPAAHDSQNQYPKQLIRMVKAAGLTSIVALTGWRRSEFGFPLSAIRNFRNDDNLDQYAFPERYEIDWFVFKTNGKSRVRREITFSIVLLAKHMALFNEANSAAPCLYQTTAKSKENVFASDLAVGAAVSALWPHYVNHYGRFQDLVQLREWRALYELEGQGQILSAEQLSKKELLLEQRSAQNWNDLQVDHNLKDAWHRSQREWPALDFIFKDSTDGEKKNWLAKYQDGTLRRDWVELIDKGVSEETKNWIRSLSKSELRTGEAALAVRHELLQDFLYPTPHAFRHIWAEAIYRRFDGDAGWMIRSQFKHVSRSMWLAYVRDKDNRGSHRLAKTRVASSLVQNYLKKAGAGYTGQLHIWLRRLTKITKIVTHEEQFRLSEHLANVEITDIKANPWGYCFLKRRTLSKAQCAEDGEPQRHNASPELCLGCTHNLMQSTNIDWLLLSLDTHLEALRSSSVPRILKTSSYRLVFNLTKQIRILNPTHPALAELDEAVGNFEQVGAIL